MWRCRRSSRSRTAPGWNAYTRSLPGTSPSPNSRTSIWPSTGRSSGRASSLTPSAISACRRRCSTPPAAPRWTPPPPTSRCGRCWSASARSRSSCRQREPHPGPSPRRRGECMRQRARSSVHVPVSLATQEKCMPPYVPFAPLTLQPEAAIDLQMHTTFSDGHSTPTHLLDHGSGERFALLAITDHDRLHTVAELQRLAAACGVRVLPAVEISSTWQGDYCDVLCFGVHPGPSDLAAIADTTHRRQEENVRAVYAALSRAGYQFPRAGEVLAERGGEPHQFDDLVDLMEAHSYTEGIGRALKDAGAELAAEFITADLGAIVEAAHASGALALIAHPGRGDGFARFDAAQ